jgi:hypothetical protein
LLSTTALCAPGDGLGCFGFWAVDGQTFPNP